MKTQAEWSLITKFPGDAKDYRVLASSAGGLDVQGIRRWLTGEVPFDANSYNPGAPWYQFGVEGDPLQQILIRQEWTEYADYTGRPILITTCLLLSFVDLAKAGCGFGQLVEVFGQGDVKAIMTEVIEGIKKGQEKKDFARLEVSLPEQGETLLRNKQIVDEIGYDSCVMASDALLRGPLCLVQAGGVIPLWQDRLKWLDAALVLLPYGLRADCSTTLWASSSAPHAMRLYWGRESRQGHARLMIPVGVPPASKENQEEYILNLLSKVKSGIDIEEVLGYLLKQGAPYSFASLPRDILLRLGRNIDFSNNIGTTPSSFTRDNPISSDKLSSDIYHSSRKEDDRSATDISLKEIIGNFISSVKESISGKKGQSNSNLSSEDSYTIIEKILETFRKTIISTEARNEMSRMTLLLSSGRVKDLYDRMLASWEKLDYRKGEHMVIFLVLMQETLNKKGKNNKHYDELAVWAGNHLPDVFWYEWMRIIIMDIDNILDNSFDSFDRCFGHLEDKNNTDLKDAVRVAYGLDGEIENEYSFPVFEKLFFEKKKMEYPICLIYYSVERGTLGKVFEPVGSWLLKKKNTGVNLPDEYMGIMLKKIKDFRFTNNQQKIFNELKSGYKF